MNFSVKIGLLLGVILIICWIAAGFIIDHNNSSYREYINYDGQNILQQMLSILSQDEAYVRERLTESVEKQFDQHQNLAFLGLINRKNEFVFDHYATGYRNLIGAAFQGPTKQDDGLLQLELGNSHMMKYVRSLYLNNRFQGKIILYYDMEEIVGFNTQVYINILIFYLIISLVTIFAAFRLKRTQKPVRSFRHPKTLPNRKVVSLHQRTQQRKQALSSQKSDENVKYVYNRHR